MHKNFRLFAPLIFLLMGLSVVLTGLSLLADRWLFIVSALLTSIVFFIVVVLIHRANNKVGKTLEDIGDSILYANSYAFADTTIPTLSVFEGGEIIWYNDSCKEMVFQGADQRGEHIANLFPNLDFTKPSDFSGEMLEYNQHKYTAFVTIGKRNGKEISVVNFFDDTDMKTIVEEFDDTRISVALVLVDSYEELLQDYNDLERAKIMGAIEDTIRSYFSQHHGFISKLDRNQFLVIVEERGVEEILKKNFDLLDQVRELETADKMPATLSIGLGRNAKSIQQSYEMAKQALDMCLGRGGDQAAIRGKNGYDFYGGVSTGVEKRTKVKTRIIASALAELIKTSNQVVVMAHRFADLDALGASVGIMKAARELNPNTFICIDEERNLVHQQLENLRNHGYGDKDFRSPKDTLAAMGRNTLLIVVDVHVPNVLESEEVLHAAKNTVVIDHHRKLVGYIRDAVIFYHEPHASSASEMVTEVIQYFPKPPNLGKVEAEALLAGIMLDTKNFVMRTGVRTFEAAAYLRQMGADTVVVRKMFASSMESYKQKSAIVAEAQVYKNCAIAVALHQFDNIRIAASQAADDLMNITGINASFVLFPYDSVINVSARSLGGINVQIVMESLGGGGHLTMAAAQFPETGLEDVLERVKKAIDNFYDSLPEDRRKELYYPISTVEETREVPDEGTILEGQALEDIKTADLE